MIRLYLTLTYHQMIELKEHFRMNGYHVSWEDDDIIDVDEDELDYVKTVLYDRGIGYTE